MSEDDETFILDMQGGKAGCHVAKGDVSSTLATTHGGAHAVLEKRDVNCLNPHDSQSERIYGDDGAWHSLNANSNGGQSRDAVLVENPSCGAFMGGQGSKAGGIGYEDELSPTLKSAPSGGNTGPDVICFEPGIAKRDGGDSRFSDGVASTIRANMGDNQPAVCFQQNQRNEVRMMGGDGDVAGTLNAEIGMKGQNYAAYPLDMDKLKPSNNTEEAFANGERKGGNGFGVGDDNDPSYTLNTVDKHGVVFKGYVRRLLVVECERLMGFPDNHTIPAFAPGDITDELVERFVDVFWTWDQMNAEDPSKVKRKTAKFVRAWLEKTRSPKTCPDAPRYKACGNSMCVNCMRWLGLGIVEVERRRQENGK